jgi:hypothetical protein
MEFDAQGSRFRGDIQTGKIEELRDLEPEDLNLEGKSRKVGDLKTLSFDWEGLEEHHRKIDLQVSPDDTWRIAALSTGSVQILKEGSDGERLYLKPPSPLTRVLSMECSGNFLALTRLLPIIHPDYHVPMQFCIELWNWRAQTRLMVLKSDEYPYPATLKFQITDRESYLLVGYPFRGGASFLLAHHTISDNRAKQNQLPRVALGHSLQLL